MDYRKEIIKYAKLMCEKGYAVATDGNLSVLMDDGNILITPSGFRKGEITEDSLVVISRDGEKIEGKYEPSMEKWMHIFIYEVRQDVRAIIHAHPPYATAFSLQMPREYEPMLPEINMFIGKFGFVDYKEPGTIELAELVKEKAPKYNVLILQKHGIVTYGKTLFDAFNNLERLEFEIKIRALKNLFKFQH
jgi:L-fuculose-phosphate aldolase